MKRIIERDEQDHILKFLTGLNDTFTATRGQILMMEPRPNISKVFNLVCQEERQLSMKIQALLLSMYLTLLLMQLLWRLTMLAITRIGLGPSVLTVAWQDTLLTSAINFMVIRKDISLDSRFRFKLQLLKDLISHGHLARTMWLIGST